MNNNIRIWSKTKKQFVYNGTFLDLVEEIQRSCNPYEFLNVNDVIVQLGSGLFDANDKEIFEGDYLIVDGLHKKWYEEVLFQNGSFIFNTWNLWDNFISTRQDLRIIGNNKENTNLKVKA